MIKPCPYNIDSFSPSTMRKWEKYIWVYFFNGRTPPPQKKSGRKLCQLIIFYWRIWRYPVFWKFAKDLHEYLFPFTERNLTFSFMRKRWKVKISVSFTTRHPEWWEWLHQAPSGELHLASWHQAAIPLSCACEQHLCSISIYFKHPLTRCVLRYQKGPRNVIFEV